MKKGGGEKEKGEKEKGEREKKKRKERGVLWCLADQRRARGMRKRKRWDIDWYWCRDGGSPGKISGDQDLGQKDLE
jgi:hypothetical protein